MKERICSICKKPSGTSSNRCNPCNRIYTAALREAKRPKTKECKHCGSECVIGTQIARNAKVCNACRESGLASKPALTNRRYYRLTDEMTPEQREARNSRQREYMKARRVQLAPVVKVCGHCGKECINGVDISRKATRYCLDCKAAGFDRLKNASEQYVKRIERIRAYIAECRKDPLWRAADRVRVSARRAAVLQAAGLAYFDKKHMQELRAIYVEAQLLGLSVDHIVPLKGKTVCGLHVPWNMELVTRKANSEKHNRMPPEHKRIGHRQWLLEVEKDE
jgi:hypothetical protein